MERVFITRYKRGIRVLTRGPDAALVLDSFNRNLKQPKINKERGRVFITEGDNFYAQDAKTGAYYYNRELLPELESKLNSHAHGVGGMQTINIVYDDVDACKGTDVDFSKHTLSLVEPEDSPFAEQNGVIDKASEEARDHAILEVQTGRGKSVSLDTAVLTTKGWLLAKQIREGDMLFGQNGKPTKCVGVFEHEDLEMYEIETNDGRKLSVCKDHLWQTKTDGESEWVLRTTMEMLDGRAYAIPVCSPVEFDVGDKLPIDPYLLGILLGDGHLKLGDVKISNLEVFIHEKINSVFDSDKGFVKQTAGRMLPELVPVKETAEELERELTELGLLGKRSKPKLVPSLYMTAPVESRWELLRGLMDSCGTVNTDNCVLSFCTPSEKLAVTTQELVWSLGGKARLTEKEFPNGRIVYSVIIKLRTPSDAFNLPRKALAAAELGMGNELKLGIVSIEKIDNAPGVCFRVEAPDSLFIVENYLVTHNTAMGQKIIVSRGKRTLILTKAAYVEKWKGDLTQSNNSLSLRPGELIVVKGVKSMDDLLEMGRDGELEAGKGRKECKVILISSNTFELWMKDVLAGRGNIDPTSILDTLGVGTMLYDETHQFFRMNYISYLLLNPDYCIDLSATLIPRSSDQFAKKRYAERFPVRSRIELDYVRYIDALSIYFHTGNKEMLRRINRMKMYNHIEFEKFVLKRKSILAKYFDMMHKLLEMFFINDYKDGQRALVFFASKIMCTEFTQYLKERLPSFDIQRHIQGDSYKDFVNADIGVSTPGKSGTAVDIPGLIFTLVSVAISKEDTNLQILGRTRQDRKWGLNPKVVFLHCEEIRKHIDYLKVRQRTFEGKVRSFKILNSGFNI